VPYVALGWRRAWRGAVRPVGVEVGVLGSDGRVPDVGRVEQGFSGEGDAAGAELQNELGFCLAGFQISLP
jgi:hypothetical protein